MDNLDIISWNFYLKHEVFRSGIFHMNYFFFLQITTRYSIFSVFEQSENKFITRAHRMQEHMKAQQKVIFVSFVFYEGVGNLKVDLLANMYLTDYRWGGVICKIFWESFDFCCKFFNFQTVSWSAASYDSKYERCNNKSLSQWCDSASSCGCGCGQKTSLRPGTV